MRNGKHGGEYQEMIGESFYTIYTSALKHRWNRVYPRDVLTFEPVRDMFDRLIDRGRLNASIEVLREIERKDDKLKEWCVERRKKLFVEIDDLMQVEVGRIIEEFPRMTGLKGTRNSADPFVIALALSSLPTLIVVSNEGLGESQGDTKIPHVCKELGLRHIDLLTLIRQEI